MSHISEMIENAEVGRTYVTGVTVDEIYKAWNESSRSSTHDIVVHQCNGYMYTPSRNVDERNIFEFYIKPKRDEYNGDMLQAAFALIGIFVTVCVIIGWFMS